MFNGAASALFGFYKYSFIDRIFIKLQTRALGVKFERLFILIPVVIYMNSENRAKLASNSKKYLFENISPRNLAIKVYDRVVLKLLDYESNEEIFNEDKERAFDILSQNIQLYLVVDRILGNDFIEQRNYIEQTIKKLYDDSYVISDHSLNLLRFQEQHFIN